MPSTTQIVVAVVVVAVVVAVALGLGLGLGLPKKTTAPPPPPPPPPPPASQTKFPNAPLAQCNTVGVNTSSPYAFVVVNKSSYAFTQDGGPQLYQVPTSGPDAYSIHGFQFPNWNAVPASNNDSPFTFTFQGPTAALMPQQGNLIVLGQQQSYNKGAVIQASPAYVLCDPTAFNTITLVDAPAGSEYPVALQFN